MRLKMADTESSLFIDRVLYFSLHRYDNGFYFPCADDANYNYVGSGDGVGFNINVAWNGTAKGDTEYLLAFYHVLMPVALEVSLCDVSCNPEFCIT